MNQTKFALFVAAAVLALTSGCGPAGTRDADSSGSRSSAAHVSGGVGVTRKAPPRPAIPWDDPEGLDTNLSQAAATGQLGFPVADPRLGRDPDLVRVSDPSSTPSRNRELIMLFRFPQGSPEFPTDGRVLLTESLADIDASTLQNMAADTAWGPEAVFQLVTFPGGTGLVMSNTNMNVGRVWLLRGGLKYDLTGPALSPNTARMLAERLLASRLVPQATLSS